MDKLNKIKEILKDASYDETLLIEQEIKNKLSEHRTALLTKLKS